MKLKDFQEQIFFSTVRITIPNENGKGASIGTGFLFSVPFSDDGEQVFMLLISNRHVYGENPKGTIILNYHKKKEDGSGPELGNVLTVQYNDFDRIYVGHPDKSIDLACINVSDATHKNVFFKNLYPEMICSFDEDDLLPGNEVWFIGYPENRFDISHNLPILRRGYIASIPKVDFNSKKEFIIDAQVFPGSSGSPVFAILGNSYKLIGVVAQTMIRFGQLESVPAALSIGVQQTLGLGIVIKATCIKELIDYAIKEFMVRYNIKLVQ